MGQRLKASAVTPTIKPAPFITATQPEEIGAGSGNPCWYRLTEIGILSFGVNLESLSAAIIPKVASKEQGAHPLSIKS